MRLPRVPGWLTASITMSLGGLLNGMDTGSIGALTTMPAFSETFGTLSSTELGLVVSAVMLTGGVPAAFAGRIADRFGASRVVCAGALVLLIGAILEASSEALAQLVLGRAVVGLGQGLILTNVVVYVCEIAPAARRGVLVSSTQLLVTIGIVVGFFTCYGSIAIPSSWSWRTPFLVQAGVALALCVSAFSVPPSPRWLLSHGRRDEAETAIRRLSIPAAEAEKDMLQPFLADQRLAPERRKQSFWSIFAAPVRLRTFLALFLLGMMQLSGIDGVLFYAPLLFRQAGLAAGTATFLASGVSAIAIFAISIPAFLLADRIGRRTSLIGGGLGMTACLFTMGALYQSGSVHASTGAARWVVVTLIFLFAILYAATWAISAKLYAGEIQPTHTRLAANSLSQGLGFFTNFLVAFFTPILLSRSVSGAYFLFGSLTLVTVAVCAFYMPETRGRSLEAIHNDRFVAPGPAAVRKLASRLRYAVGLRARRETHGQSLATVELHREALPRMPSSADIELQDVGGLLAATGSVTASPLTSQVEPSPEPILLGKKDGPEQVTATSVDM